MNDKSGFEQAVSQFVTLAIRRQLKRVAGIEIQIKTDLKKLMQGHLDAMTIAIQGILLASQLEAEFLRLQIGQIQVKPLSAMRGNIILVHPSEGMLEIVINQVDLTTALNAEDSWRSPTPASAPAPITVDFSEYRITLSLDSPQGESAPATVTLTPEIAPDGKTIVLLPVPSEAGQAPAAELTQALLTRLSQLFSLEEFEQKGVSLQIQQLNVAAGKLTLQAAAQIERFPA